MYLEFSNQVMHKINVNVNWNDGKYWKAVAPTKSYKENAKITHQLHLIYNNEYKNLW